MNYFKKLLPLVQLIPALAVAGIIAAALPRTAPVLAEIPERLVLAVVETADSVPDPEPEETETEPALPYEDGIYTGSSRGYGGRIRMQVTMENGFITDLQILDASYETPSFLKRTRRLLNIVMAGQSWEVDAISEATYTSRGILGAIRNALTGEEVINPTPPKAPTELPVLEEFVVPSVYRDGVYIGTAEGYGGEIAVQVTIESDAITDITVLSAEDETRSYFTRARYVISAMLTSGTPEVDAVSGATYSSVGIINAVKSALCSAAADSDRIEELPDSAATEESEAVEPMQPVVEVVRPKEKRTVLREQIKALWNKLFPRRSDADDSDGASAQTEIEAEDLVAATDEPNVDRESISEDIADPSVPATDTMLPEAEDPPIIEQPDQQEDAE